ncbi:MAG: Tricorn protease [Candidatus Marinimicrobia bacterium]|nr:Tricorn protease [Candidatus Neomarinimicrobiota bacterium]
MILERLRRTLIGMGMSRHGTTSTVPPQVFSGYMACLANGYSASDGDIFPYYFKKYDLGPVIGMRTWGGVRGIRGNPGIMDGGYIFPPEFSRYDLDSTWNMENSGVAPDIEVDNLPNLVVEGKDPQLERAVEYLLKQIAENPDSLHLELPPAPDFEKPYPEEYYEQLEE